MITHFSYIHNIIGKHIYTYSYTYERKSYALFAPAHAFAYNMHITHKIANLTKQFTWQKAPKERFLLMF